MEANKQGKINIAIGIVLFIIVFTLVSCGARKVEKSKTETKETVQAETTKVDSSKTTTIANSNVKIVDSSITDEVEVMPLDNTKEMVVNGKTYFNSIIKHRRIKNNIVTNKIFDIKINENKNVFEKNNYKSNKSILSNVKNIDKKQFNIFSLWWLFIIIILCIIYYKKYGFRLPII